MEGNKEVSHNIFSAMFIQKDNPNTRINVPPTINEIKF